LSDDRPNPRASGEFYPSAFDYVTATAARRVLLAQADEQLRHLFATGLRRTGHAVLATSEGEQALSLLSSISRGELPKPHAIVLDLHLPIHSGLQILAALRRAGWRVPVIVLGSSPDERMRALVDRFDVFACLAKPVSTAVLARAIGEAIDATPTEEPTA
jgi:DNA-binding response OmpR family regulator